jgi:hypothetical protein
VVCGGAFNTQNNARKGSSRDTSKNDATQAKTTRNVERRGMVVQGTSTSNVGRCLPPPFLLINVSRCEAQNNTTSKHIILYVRYKIRGRGTLLRALRAHFWLDMGLLSRTKLDVDCPNNNNNINTIVIISTASPSVHFVRAHVISSVHSRSLPSGTSHHLIIHRSHH